MIIKSMLSKSVPAVLSTFICAGIGLSPVSVCASTIGLPATGNPGMGHGRSDDMLMFADIEFPPASANMTFLPATGNPGNGYGRPEYVPGNPRMGHGKHDHVPPVNPPIDTPAFDKGLANNPVIPGVAPGYTLPGSDFGQVAVVPVPGAVWLFGSGLLGLVGMARRKKA
jgi:hypothetical protein